MTGIKRYLVFAYDQYEAGGGWQDFKGTLDDKEQANYYAKKLVTKGVLQDGETIVFDYAEVVDTHDTEMWGTFRRIDFIDEIHFGA